MNLVLFEYREIHTAVYPFFHKVRMCVEIVFLAMFQHDLNLYDRKLVLDAFGLMSEEETEKYYKWLETFCKKGYLMQD